MAGIAEKYPHLFSNMLPSEVTHVTENMQCLLDVIDGKIHPELTGSFVNALLRDSLSLAYRHADPLNVRYLHVYAAFIYHCLPAGALQAILRKKG